MQVLTRLVCSIGGPGAVALVQRVKQRVVSPAMAGQQGIVVGFEATVAQAVEAAPRQPLGLVEERLGRVVGVAQHRRGHMHGVVAGRVFAHRECRPLAAVAAQGIGFGNGQVQLHGQLTAAQVVHAGFEGAIRPVQEAVETS